eukprot:4550472-Pleurochrysis_carterae.AAC.1
MLLANVTPCNVFGLTWSAVGVPLHQNTFQSSETTTPPTTTSAAPSVPSVVTPPPTITTDQPAPTINDTDRNTERQTHDQRAFKRTIGPYPLRSRGAALLVLRFRRDKPQWGRNTACAFAACAASTDPRVESPTWLSSVSPIIAWGYSK